MLKHCGVCFVDGRLSTSPRASSTVDVQAASASPRSAVASDTYACRGLLQRRMVDGNMLIDAQGPYKTLQDLWDE